MSGNAARADWLKGNIKRRPLQIYEFSGRLAPDRQGPQEDFCRGVNWSESVPLDGRRHRFVGGPELSSCGRGGRRPKHRPAFLEAPGAFFDADWLDPKTPTS